MILFPLFFTANAIPTINAHRSSQIRNSCLCQFLEDWPSCIKKRKVSAKLSQSICSSGQIEIEYALMYRKCRY